MRLRIIHTTTFSYDVPVSEAYMEMRLSPLDAGGQRCEKQRLSTDPAGEVMGYTDRFGNRVRHFDTLAPHDRLVVSALSEVVTPEGYFEPERELSALDAFDYLQPTAQTPMTDTVSALAFPCRVHGDALATALALMSAVNDALAYAQGITNVRTTAAEALERGRGVCQDFSHVMIAACRSLGLPARYVSGYVFEPKRSAAVASHAWIDVFTDSQGWVSLDPTHHSPQTEHYVRVAVGRDYDDVPPTRGVYKGAGHETMSVDVHVEQV